ncbi:MAG: hypothetical protein K5987_01240 [Lachnospiraceae bacterium]|nr:hypothetical protein [Lachnospiraceae bacterium]
MKKGSVISFATLFVLAGIFVVLLSPSTSPLSPFFYGGDSAYFQSDGRVWSDGYIPYKDFFDHKGPILLFINMIAYRTHYPRYVLCFFQTIFLGLFFFSEYLFLKKEVGEDKNKRLFAFMLMLASGLHVAITVEEGNNTELYCLAPCYIPFCNELIWLRSDRSDHDIKSAFVDGVCLGIIFFINAKNALSLCLAILMVIISLIYRKRLKNLMLNMVAGLMGVLIVFLPFCIYFMLQDALYDMMYATFLFNFKYLLTGNAYKKSMYKLLLLSLPQIAIFFSALAGMFSSKENKRGVFFNICVAVISFVTEYYFISGMTFKHYFLTGAVFIPVLIMFTGDHKGIVRLFSNIIICLFTGICIATFFTHTITWYSDIYSEERKADYKSRMDTLEYLCSLIPDSKHNKVYVYQTTCNELYAVTDLGPVQRFPYITEFLEYVDPDIKEEIKNSFNTILPEYVITGRVGDTDISALINERYDVIYETCLPRDDLGAANDDYICLYALRSK